LILIEPESIWRELTRRDDPLDAEIWSLQQFFEYLFWSCGEVLEDIWGFAHYRNRCTNSLAALPISNVE
jgi:hypothetical protein